MKRLTRATVLLAGLGTLIWTIGAPYLSGG
jgi:hypothetical protein